MRRAYMVHFDNFPYWWYFLVAFDELYDGIVDEEVDDFDHRQQTAAHEQPEIAAQVT